MERAIAERIPVVEWMFERALAVDPALRLDQLRRWRAAGGHCLSIHFPKLPLAPDPEAEAKTAATVRLALESRADRVTVHVPDFPVGEAESRLEAAVERYVALLKPLLAAGIRIGIENLHTTPGATDDAHRNYGCTIEECRAWIEDLRAVSAAPKHIGFHLDIGHARNNAPFSATENLSDYYRRLGSIVNGYHFHQVRQNPDGSFSNHRRLNGLYDKLISLSGFLLALREGQLPHSPVFLEINEDNAGIECWQKLTQTLG